MSDRLLWAAAPWNELMKIRNIPFCSSRAEAGDVENVCRLLTIYFFGAISFYCFDWVQYSPKRRWQISPFRSPPDKLHNNHSVSRLPPGLRFQFCAAVPRRSRELTSKFCSGQWGSALQWPFDSLLLKLRLKGWNIIQQPGYPSLPATCSSSLVVLPCMSDEATRSLSGFCSASPPSPLLPTFWGTTGEPLETRLYWLTCSLAEEKRGSSGEDPQAVSFIWVKMEFVIIKPQ